jgi:hypothetical protein
VRHMRRPAFTARSLTLGALFNIIFGTLWLGNGLYALESIQTLFAALAVVTTTLLVASLSLFRSLRRFPLQMPADELQYRNRAISRTTIIQLVGSTILSLLLMLVGRSELMLPMLVLSVGLYQAFPGTHPQVGALLHRRCAAVPPAHRDRPAGPCQHHSRRSGGPPGTGWLILVGLIGGGIQFGLASVNLGVTVFLRRTLRTGKALEGAAHG